MQEFVPHSWGSRNIKRFLLVKENAPCVNELSACPCGENAESGLVETTLWVCFLGAWGQCLALLRLNLLRVHRGGGARSGLGEWSWMQRLLS